MSDTVSRWARDSFAQLKTALSGISSEQSESEIIIDQAPPGLHRIKIWLDGNSGNPGLIIVQQGKPNLAPDLISGEPQEVEASYNRFDAIYDGLIFGWIYPDDLESLRSTDDVATHIRGLA